MGLDLLDLDCARSQTIHPGVDLGHVAEPFRRAVLLPHGELPLWIRFSVRCCVHRLNPCHPHPVIVGVKLTIRAGRPHVEALGKQFITEFLFPAVLDLNGEPVALQSIREAPLFIFKTENGLDCLVYFLIGGLPFQAKLELHVPLVNGIFNVLLQSDKTRDRDQRDQTACECMLAGPFEHAKKGEYQRDG